MIQTHTTLKGELCSVQVRRTIFQVTPSVGLHTSPVVEGPPDTSTSNARYSPSYVDRIWDIWGSQYNIPKAILYLIKGDYNRSLPDWPVEPPENYYYMASVCDQ